MLFQQTSRQDLSVGHGKKTLSSARTHSHRKLRLDKAKAHYRGKIPLSEASDLNRSEVDLVKGTGPWQNLQCADRQITVRKKKRKKKRKKLETIR